MLKNTLETLKTVGEEGPFYMESQIWPLGSFPTFLGGSRSKTRSNRAKTKHTRKHARSFPVQFPVEILVKFPVQILV
jgi:hypothetical protein